ncbi:YdgA family protein [Halomonas sp. IOP_14]|uniref:YdgA family protein n=1 Tax=Halomonas sp. IOP_14 TaxID=2873295 RepID=UPI001E551CFE|nr:YdgA family protein [Halomonas sp. IOP_14]MCD1584532.1 YdgA family protein [Halomonas sp. IOP_14]
MGKLLSLIVIVALGYTGIYFYYGVVVEREIQEQLDDRGLSAVSIDNVEYDVLAPVSTSADIAVTVTYRGSQATLDLAVQGHPLFSDEVTVEFDGLQALRLGISFGQ